MTAPSYIGSTLGNDGTTQVGDSSFGMAVHASAAVGDVAVITAVMNTGTVTFSLSGGAGGWTLWSGPDDVSGNLRTYVWAKELVSGDIGATITVNASGGSGRFIGRMDVFRNVDFANCADTFSEDSTADTSIVAPGISISDTNCLIYNIYVLRTAAASSTTITSHIASHTARGGICNTNVASPNYSMEATTFAPGSTGTQGGGTATAGASSTDRTYSIELRGTTAATQNLSPTAIASAGAFGTPVVSTTVTTAPTAIATGGAFGTAVVSTTITSSPTSIATAEAFGTPSILQTTPVAPDSIPSGESVGEPTVTLGTGQAAPASIESLEAFGTPVISTTIELAPDSIASEEVVPEPSIQADWPDVLLDSISSQASVGTPTVSVQTLVRRFNPPFVIHDHQMKGALIASLQYGLTVFRIDGEWGTAEYPTTAQEAAADRFYRGGYIHSLTEEEAAELEAEGYTITTEFL